MSEHVESDAQVSEDFEDECVLVGDTGHVAPAEATLSVMVAHPQLVTAYKYALFQHNALSGGFLFQLQQEWLLPLPVCLLGIVLLFVCHLRKLDLPVSAARSSFQPEGSPALADWCS